ncbi:type II inositol 3,4-bisphosphate 4-phosphatase-like [Salvelinus fontinalis]|uniref:type II inositol 3,4-bisphosphate 4-phosphatase-like n=1 Tax=Salvelinus fontinalis TaxID=8038 RepID=UPI0024866525|nr:type II inositol 3,4-bisphosphate 4-phosphatase-like [Salvelinus fontinalis]
MKVNSHHLTSLSKGPASSFDREGRLRVGRETQGMCERWCRLRGNLLFIMKKPQQRSALEEVLVLERCHILESTENNNGLLIRFDSGEPGVYVECVNSGEVNSWLVALREANSEGLTNRIRHLRTQLMGTAGNAETTVVDAVSPAKLSPLEFSIDCRGLSIGHREKRPHAVVQVSVINTQTHTIADYCCTEIVESNSDPVFLTGVCVSPDHPFTLDTTLKLTAYHAKAKTHDTIQSKAGGIFSVLGSSCSFKTSCSKSDRYLEFIPVNLHTQRMQVTCSRRTVWYDVVTVGAPADHYQGFKHGGLQRLLNKPDSDNRSVSSAHCCISYSPEESSRAREVLSSVSQLQPLISGLTEELLQAALEVNSQRLPDILHSLAHRTEQFVHAVKDELVKNALLALHAARPAYHLSNGHAHVTHGNGTGPRLSSANQDGLWPSMRRQEYDEEEWDRVWANVAMSLNCIIAMVDRLQERENRKQEVTSQTQNDVTTTKHNTDPSRSPWQASLAHLPDPSRAPWQASLAPLPDPSPSPWQEQLLPLVVTLKECVCDAVEGARCAMTFVLLQGAAASACHGQALTHRRDAVFSQALCAVVCGFVLRLYSGLEDKDFLLQLCEVGLITQFEGLLSTYSDEVGMLEDMEMGVSDLNRVSFKITEAKSDQPTDLLPSVTGLRGCFCVEVPLPSETYLLLPAELRDGRDLRVHPLLFNIGINQQQSLAERFGDSSLQERINLRSCEMLKSYYKTLRDKLPNLTLPCSRSPLAVEDLLCSLEQSLEMKKRKNVEVLWLAASVCRRLNGVRLTSCKSAKDRTSMSVTLEQCMLLRDEHTLSKEHFNRALDCMRSSRLQQGQIVGCWDPERGAGSWSGFRGEQKTPAAPGRHFYPVALLLITSHLLVVWLILSMVVVTGK